VSAITLDPLIVEAKRRARRRHLVALAIAVGVAGAVAIYWSARESRPARVSIPAGATGAACGVRGVGARIFSPGGRLLYREPSSPMGGFPAIQCSGSTIWAVWLNGAGMMQQAYFGARSLDRGRTWRPVFTEREFQLKAPHQLDAYLGVWTLRGSNAYFVGSCPACSNHGVEVTNALFVTKNGGRTFERYNAPALTGYLVTGIRVRGADVILRGKQFIRSVVPPRKTVTIRVG
jgi:hypothetical protein